MKKLLAGLGAVALAGTMAFSVFAVQDDPAPDAVPITPGADGLPSRSAAGMGIEFEAPEAVRYTVTIPSEVTLEKNAPVPFTIEAENVSLRSGDAVFVSFDAGSRLEVANAGDILHYTVGRTGENDQETVFSDEDVADGVCLTSFTQDGADQFMFRLLPKSDGSFGRYAGEYTGTLTFNITVEPTGGVIGGGT